MRKHGQAFVLIILVLAALNLQGATPVFAVTIMVTTSTDEDSHPGAGVGCSLREAIIAANTDAAYGGCPAGSGADTIRLSDGVYRLTLGSELTIASSITLNSLSGVRANTIIEAAATPNTVNYRVFNVTDVGYFTLQAVTVRHGGMGFFPLDGGGGIRSTGILIATDSIISDNRASGGAGVFTTGRTWIFSSLITNNIAFLQGGGLHVSGDTIITEGTNIEYNSAASGGGIYKGGSTSFLDMLGVFVRFNTGTQGVGGIHHNLGIFSMEYSALEFNLGGGYLNNGDPSSSLYSTTFNRVCIVGNDDVALVDTAPDGVTIVYRSWWGSSEGPYDGVSDSIGDSISGFVTSSEHLLTPVVPTVSGTLGFACGTCTRTSAITGGRDLRTCSPVSP